MPASPLLENDLVKLFDNDFSDKKLYNTKLPTFEEKLE
jgi:hypothetical protein